MSVESTSQAAKDRSNCTEIADRTITCARPGILHLDELVIAAPGGPEWGDSLTDGLVWKGKWPETAKESGCDKMATVSTRGVWGGKEKLGAWRYLHGAVAVSSTQGNPPGARRPSIVP